jgi:hypothetical protein
MSTSLVPGSSYRLVATINIGRCEFQAGEVVVFTSGGYSPYDDCYVYHFVGPSGESRICASQAELTESEQTSFKPAP